MVSLAIRMYLRKEKNTCHVLGIVVKRPNKKEKERERTEKAVRIDAELEFAIHQQWNEANKQN